MSARTHLLSSFAALLALSLGAGCVGGLEVGPEYPGPYYDYPPDTYIATTEPVYWEGHPTYYYGGRWYYRDGGRWGHYDREPVGLHDRRMGAPAARRGYEPYHGAPRGGPVGRPAGGQRRGGGGERGGGERGGGRR